ncbi:hypothetical protein D9M72_426530 [compost metagenome]
MEPEIGSALQIELARSLKRGDREPESGDGHRERIQVDAVDGIECLLHVFAGFQVRSLCAPSV